MNVQTVAQAQQQKTTPASQATGLLQRKTCSCGKSIVANGECSTCNKKRQGLQRRAVNQAGPETAPPIVHDVLRSSGHPLDAATRGFMEPRFGHDFSRVRVHTDNKAAQSAQAVNAHAYTVGKNVVFGQGQYAPGTQSGQHLLAHELTHVVQQSGHAGLQPKLAIGNANDSFEQNADCVANRITAGQSSVGNIETTSSLLQRTIGDGHDLTSSRFSGDVVLEAVYDDERLLQSGSRGPVVTKLQQALIDAGFSLPRFGVDGIFGAETKAAVEQFQRHSGLSGTSVDGIVGPITMGWLDQRFSAGPTPAGTGTEATPGCATIKTVTVDLVSLDGSTRNPVSDLQVANTIFNQCCVRFELGGGGSAIPAQTRTWLGGDTDMAAATTCTPTAEEVNAFTGAGTEFGLSSRIRGIYVDTISGAPLDAYSFHGGCGSSTNEMVVVSNAAGSRELAHEFGHILLNQGNTAHVANVNNLMADPNPGTQVGTTQCATIFSNA